MIWSEVLVRRFASSVTITLGSMPISMACPAWASTSHLTPAAWSLSTSVSLATGCASWLSGQVGTSRLFDRWDQFDWFQDGAITSSDLSLTDVNYKRFIGVIGRARQRAMTTHRLRRIP